MLQVQVATLQAATPAAPAASTASAITFTNTPQTLNADDLIDYSTKRGSSIYHKECKALDNRALVNGTEMTPDQTVAFVEAFYHCAITMAGIKAPSKSPTSPTVPVL